MSEATVVQQRPSGTGREVTPLVISDILTRQVLVPEHGLETVALWVRSAAAYLKSRQFEKSSDPTHFLFVAEVARGLHEDVEARTMLGEARYGERLRAFNGRDALTDAYQELLDAWQYLRQHEEEQETRK